MGKTPVSTARSAQACNFDQNRRRHFRFLELKGSTKRKPKRKAKRSKEAGKKKTAKKTAKKRPAKKKPAKPGSGNSSI
jgi:hypothetical protein